MHDCRNEIGKRIVLIVELAQFALAMPTMPPTQPKFNNRRLGSLSCRETLREKLQVLLIEDQRVADRHDQSDGVVAMTHQVGRESKVGFDSGCPLRAIMEK